MLLLDENISYKTVNALREVYPGITHVRFINLVSAPDFAVWEYAKNQNLCIVTFDNDFESILMRNGYPPKVIRLTRGNISSFELVYMLSNNEQEIKKFIQNTTAGYLEIM